MAPVRWTADRDQKLFLLLLDQITVRGGINDTLAAKWKTKYVDTGIEDFQPTARAISEHITNLRGTFGGKASSKTTTPKATATPKTTPRKPAAPKTPSSSSKRKRKRSSKSSDEEDADADMPDNEDDSEAEREMLKSSPSAPRSALSRRSKGSAKNYHEDEDEDESDDDLVQLEDDASASTPVPTDMAAKDEQMDFFAGGAFDGVGEAAAQKQSCGPMQGVVSTPTAGDEGIVPGALAPQGRLLGGKKARSVTKRVFKNEGSGDDSDGSVFSPDV